MSSGSEATEMAVTFARRWAYQVKGVPENMAKFVNPEGVYMGRTFTGRQASTDPLAKLGYGPYDNSMINVKFNDLEALETLFK